MLRMERRDEIQAFLEAHAPEALHTVVDLLRHAEHPRIRLEAARLILEYGGYKPSAQHDVQLRVVQTHVRMVQEAWERRRARLASAEVVGRADAAPVSPPALDRSEQLNLEDLGKTGEG